MQTANAPVDKPLDGLGKWLVMTRAAVFPMTLWSGTIGALLAVEQARLAPAGTISIDWIAVVLAVVGIVLAHAANNLINDYFDMTGGIDTDNYVRALYAPHPVLSGWVTKATLRNVMVGLTVLGGLIMLLLAYWHGPLVIVFALAGLFLSVFYVAPPFSLKRHGLGELDVFLTWGPLMIGGTYLVAVTPLDTSKLIQVMLFSMPYALLVTSVLFGKHIDKIEPDTKLGIHTVPVILGEKLAAPYQPGADDRVLPAHPGRGARRLGRPMGAARGAGDPDSVERPQGLQLAQARGPPTVVPGARLAAVVRGLRVPPRPTRRLPADDRPGAQRPRSGEAAAPLALAAAYGKAEPSFQAQPLPAE